MRFDKIRVCRSITECFDLLNQGKVDLVAIDQLLGLYHLKNHYGDVNYFDIVPQVIDENSLHFAVPKEHPLSEEIISQFNSALEQAEAKGTISSIKDRHVEMMQN